MSRWPILFFAVALFPAAAFDLEKWADDLANRQMDKWKRETLQQATKARDPQERLEAVRRLSYADADSLPVFAIALSDSDARVRQAAASQLWKAEKRAEPFRPQLQKALDDPDPNVVAQAAGALQASGVKEADLVAPRKRVLESPDASVSARFLVARNLVGYESPRKLVGPMIDYLEHNTQDYTGSVTDNNRHNVELVEKALERMVKNTKDRSIIQPLWEALVETRNGHVQLMTALGYFEPRPEGWTRTLLRQLESPNPRVRKEALAQLGTVKQEKEVAVWAPHAGQALQDADSSVRSEALWVLGNQAGLAAGEVEKIAALASDASPGIRRSVVRSLGEIAEANQPIPAATKARVTRVARPVIEGAQQDADKDVRDEAKYALRKLGADDGRSVTPSVHSKVAVAAAPASAASEAEGMAVLRARKVSFDENSWFRALAEVDVNLVHAFLDAGMSPTASVADKGPPIRAMLWNNKACAPDVRPTLPETKAVVRMLLDRGADIHAADRDGNNALTEAAAKGCDRELIRMLIKAGAKVNVGNSSGLSPFEMGLWMGHDGLEELLAAGYRLPPDKVKVYLEGYKDRPAAIAMVKKAAGAKKK
jgi:HEAT repeat protein